MYIRRTILQGSFPPAPGNSEEKNSFSRQQMNMSETIELAFLKSAFWDMYIVQSTYYVVCSLVVLHSGLKSFMKLKYFFLQKFLLNNQVHLRKINHTFYLLTCLLAPGLDIWKKSLLHDQY